MAALRRRVAFALIAICALAAPRLAGASTFTSTQLGYDAAILSQFNLVNLGNFTANNETEGRIVVGGNATVNGTTNVCFASGCSGNTTRAVGSATTTGYGALTVFGSITGGYSTGNSGGDINIGGTSRGSFNLRNGGNFNVVGNASGTTVDSAKGVYTTQSSFAGTAQNSGAVSVSQTLTKVFPFGSFADTFTTPLTALSKGLAALPGSPGVSAQALPTGNNVYLTAANDYTVAGKHYGVVTTTLANLASEQNFQGINNNGNDATFVIVTGDGANYTLPNLNAYSNAGKVIFDFVDATTLKFGGTWSGSVLAPLANITQQGGVIDGTVVVASMTQSMELHQNNLFTGDLSGLAGFSYGTSVPEPASILLLGLAAALTGAFRRRR